ncbi:MAG: hypothetical protein ACM3MK_11065 [Chitinophagales bacterium]
MKHTRILLAVILVLSLWFVVGCGKVAEKAVEKSIETGVENSSGNDVKVDLDQNKVEIKDKDGTTYTSGGEQKWPKEMPSVVPEFKYGKIIGVSNINSEKGKNITLSFESVDKNAYQSYKKDLEDAGWTINMTSQFDTSWSLSAQKDKQMVTVTGGTDDSGALLNYAENVDQ